MNWIPLLSLTAIIQIQVIAFAYWLGKVSADHNARLSRLEEDAKGSDSLKEKVTRLVVQMESANTTLEALKRTADGTQRQLANLVVKGMAGIAGE